MWLLSWGSMYEMTMPKCCHSTSSFIRNSECCGVNLNHLHILETPDLTISHKHWTLKRWSLNLRYGCISWLEVICTVFIWIWWPCTPVNAVCHKSIETDFMKKSLLKCLHLSMIPFRSNTLLEAVLPPLKSFCVRSFSASVTAVWILSVVSKWCTVEPRLSKIKGADPISDKQYFG
jgi:hypothetical protein